jgi:hypothetical protein
MEHYLAFPTFNFHPLKFLTVRWLCTFVIILLCGRLWSSRGSIHVGKDRDISAANDCSISSLQDHDLIKVESNHQRHRNDGILRENKLWWILRVKEWSWKRVLQACRVVAADMQLKSKSGNRRQICIVTVVITCSPEPCRCIFLDKQGTKGSIRWKSPKDGVKVAHSGCHSPKYLAIYVRHTTASSTCYFQPSSLHGSWHSSKLYLRPTYSFGTCTVFLIAVTPAKRRQIQILIKMSTTTEIFHNQERQCHSLLWDHWDHWFLSTGTTTWFGIKCSRPSLFIYHSPLAFLTHGRLSRYFSSSTSSTHIRTVRRLNPSDPNNSTVICHYAPDSKSGNMTMSKQYTLLNDVVPDIHRPLS